MSVKTLYEYSCDCCGGQVTVRALDSKLPDGFVGLMWADGSLTPTDDDELCAMHLCFGSGCYEKLGEMYKREMTAKEENEG